MSHTPNETPPRAIKNLNGKLLIQSYFLFSPLLQWEFEGEIKRPARTRENEKRHARGNHERQASSDEREIYLWLFREPHCRPLRLDRKKDGRRRLLLLADAPERQGACKRTRVTDQSAMSWTGGGYNFMFFYLLWSLFFSSLFLFHRIVLEVVWWKGPSQL